MPTSPEQEPLLVTGAGDQIIARDFTEIDGDLVVLLIERNIHLQNVLQTLGAIGSRVALSRAVHSDRRERIEQTYGANTDHVAQGAASKAKLLRVQAKWEFSRAFGLAQMGDKPDDKALARVDFEKLESEYAGPSNAKKKKAYIDQLERNVKIMQNEVTTKNHVEGKRPHKGDPNTDEQEDKKLDTSARLQALQTDIRAGFLPTTNLEKNRIVALLDYLDNPEYVMGSNNQWFEIYNHQERGRSGRRGAVPGGGRALESIMYEFEDFLTQSTDQLTALIDLEDRIANCMNPRVTLTEEVGVEHPGYGALVRYLDLVELRDKRSVIGMLDPLHTTTTRWATGNFPGKHKTIEDDYTGQNTSSAMAERLSGRVEHLTIGSLRQVISEAVADQAKRRHFMEQRLEETQKVRFDKRNVPAWVRLAGKILADHELAMV